MTNPDSVIEGVIQRVTFHNPSNGYSVLQVEVPTLVDPVTVTGRVLSASQGMRVIAQGSFEDHPKFGRQFLARTISESLPTEPEDQVKHLSSGIVPGIGKKLAQRLVDAFGAELIEKLAMDPDAVAKVHGIGKEKALSLAQHFQAHQAREGILRFCQQHDIPTGLTKRIYDKYGVKTLAVLTQNPYRLARELKGVGFLTADKIGISLGIREDAEVRVEGALLYALEKVGDDGHCYLSRDELINKTLDLLKPENSIPFDDAIHSLISQELLCNRNDRFYLPHILAAEDFVASWIADRCRSTNDELNAESTPSDLISKNERELGITFSNEQRQGLLLAASHPLLLITGGPGCGKTTLIRGIVAHFQSLGLQIALTAPTGRAAQRMATVCNFSASTIHRLLKFDPMTGGFVHSLHEPLQFDLIIVDEASMLDIFLMKDLCKAIPPTTRVIFVGDRDQLPSIGPGRVFSDLLSIREIPSVSLVHIFRRDSGSAINDIAFKINMGEVPQIPSPDGVTKTDAYFLPTRTAEEASDLIEHLVANQIPKHFGFTLDDILVLTPSNRGPLGTISLNERLQKRFTVEDEEQTLLDGEVQFRVGDRICQRVNNYQIDPLGVFNGDTGKIYAVDRGRKRLVVDLWDGRLITYERDSLSQLSLGYAVTVHRAQGSESPVVVLALHESHFSLLERQLLYTAITRAKKLLLIVGSKKAFAIACKKSGALKRRTGLREKIQNLLANPS